MNTKLLRITLYTNCEGWRRMDNIFNLIPIVWRLKHMWARSIKKKLFL